MAQQQGPDPDAIDFEGPLLEVPEKDAGGQFLDGDREIDVVHLRRDHLAHGGIAMGGTEDLAFVPRNIEGREVGDGVNVVPVGVGYENLKLQPRPAPPQQVIRQRLDARSRIEDEELAFGELQGHARCVPAIPEGYLAGDGQGSAYAPERHLDFVLGYILQLSHESFRIDRLDDEPVGAELERPLAVELVRLGGHDGDLGILELRPRPHFPAQLKAVHLGHHDIQEGEIGRFRFHSGEGVEARGLEQRPVARRLDQCYLNGDHVVVVVDNEVCLGLFLFHGLPRVIIYHCVLHLQEIIRIASATP